MPRGIKLIKSIPKNELMERYKKETNARIKPRLLAIIHLYEGKTGKEASELVKTSYPSLIRWVERWNKDGYEGLVPNFTGGYKPQLDGATWDKIINEIKDKGMALKDVRVYVKTKYGAELSYFGVWYWVRGKKKAPYGKPYLEDDRRPKDAEDILKKA